MKHFDFIGDYYDYRKFLKDSNKVIPPCAYGEFLQTKPKKKLKKRGRRR